MNNNCDNNNNKVVTIVIIIIMIIKVLEYINIQYSNIPIILINNETVAIFRVDGQH